VGVSVAVDVEVAVGGRSVMSSCQQNSVPKSLGNVSSTRSVQFPLTGVLSKAVKDSLGRNEPANGGEPDEIDEPASSSNVVKVPLQSVEPLP